MALTEVNSLGIKDLEVKTADIAADAVTADKLANSLDIPDNNKIRFGDDNDLSIYSSGSGGTIEGIAGANMHIKAKSGEDGIIIKPDNEVELYYDNVKKFETTSAGATVTGTLTADLADNSIDSEHYVDGSIDHVHLAGDAVDGDNIADDSIGAEHIADNAVGLAAMAHGTDGQIITYDANGAPVAVGPGTDGQVLTSTGAGSPPAFEDAAGGGPSLSNGAADRIVTADGANSLNGEANLTYATNLTITNGSYYVGTSGHGLDFSLTGQQSGMTSERLDNYEEGSFTVEVQNGWGILNPGYAHNTCRYTLIGRMVHCFGRLQLNAGSENSNQIYITGFPFVTAAWTSQHYPMATGFFNAADADGQHFAGHISPNSTYLYFHKQTATNAAALNGDDVGDTFDLMFSITYQT